MKKFVALLTVIALCLSFTACGSCDHQYEEKVTLEPTCTAVGVKTFTCTSCEDTYTEDIPMIEHAFGEATVTKEATCTATGEKSATCTVCGLTQVTEEIPMAEHTIGKSTVTKEPTCTAEGEKKASCTVCGGSDITESIPKAAHKYTEKVTKKATCTAEGEKTYTCSVCAHSYTEGIAKSKHNYASKTTKAATCTAKGEKVFTCKDCNHSYSEDIKIKDHDYSSKTTKAATCTAKGEKVLTCKDCSHTYTETVAAKGHKWVDATCTKAGYCSVCKAAGEAAQGHDFGYGNCFECGMSPLTLPNVPVTITDYYNNGKIDTTIEITDLDLVFEKYYASSKESLWKITFIGTATYNSDGNGVSTPMYFSYKLYDEDGFVVESYNVLTESICVGEKFRKTISLWLEPGKSYRLELLDVM